MLTNSSYNKSTDIEYYIEKFITEFSQKKEPIQINFREIIPTDDISDNEWKIALMVEYLDDNCSDDYLENFHFLRSNKNNNWIHKESYLSQISKKDDLNNNITDPRNCDMPLYQYKKCYALSLNR